MNREMEMALDIVIIADSGQPELSVPVEVNAHERFLGIVEEAQYPLLSRLRDYYEDAQYDTGELDLLSAELTSVASRVGRDEELVRLVAELKEIAAAAKRLDRQLIAIAD